MTKPAAPVRPGDVLTLVQGGAVRVVRVRGAAERRGPATEAQALYEDLAGTPDARGPADSLEPGRADP